MRPLILRAKDVQTLLNLCRTDSYKVIKELKDEYPYSAKLKGSKVRIEDFAEAYNLKIEMIYSTLFGLIE